MIAAAMVDAVAVMVARAVVAKGWKLWYGSKLAVAVAVVIANAGSTPVATAVVTASGVAIAVVATRGIDAIIAIAATARLPPPSQQRRHCHRKRFSAIQN